MKSRWTKRPKLWWTRSGRIWASSKCKRERPRSCWGELACNGKTRLKGLGRDGFRLCGKALGVGVLKGHGFPAVRKSLKTMYGVAGSRAPSRFQPLISMFSSRLFSRTDRGEDNVGLSPQGNVPTIEWKRHEQG